jgi:hypothetical protein
MFPEATDQLRILTEYGYVSFTVTSFPVVVQSDVWHGYVSAAHEVTVTPRLAAFRLVAEA